MSSTSFMIAPFRMRLPTDRSRPCVHQGFSAPRRPSSPRRSGREAASWWRQVPLRAWARESMPTANTVARWILEHARHARGRTTYGSMYAAAPNDAVGSLFFCEILRSAHDGVRRAWRSLTPSSCSAQSQTPQCNPRNPAPSRGGCGLHRIRTALKEG